jgi:Arc/MetJ family transcription regulator
MVTHHDLVYHCGAKEGQPMTRMTVTVDPRLLEEAQEVLGTATKADTLRQALQEVLRRARLARALGHQGRIDLDLDQEKLAALRAEG